MSNFSRLKFPPPRTMERMIFLTSDCSGVMFLRKSMAAVAVAVAVAVVVVAEGLTEVSSGLEVPVVSVAAVSLFGSAAGSGISSSSS
ncbi:hypothetical protein WICPIJ_000475 [Wickerhamomyces pijperi]|uniref:Uncharacterized protein n=1 Tax=Wickerhamomyces pijperi TaxID=599730 RepID=A0A9P8QGY1_WICPI|nr:hypothetical protein WICPIJ_000475 [Wickerhamomyces pijperi]